MYAYCALLVDELVVFDVFHTVSYLMLGVYYYYIEYKDRYDFFVHLTQIETHASHKRLLDALPTGIILLDDDNAPVFYNHFVEGMMERKGLPLTQRSPDESEDIKSLQSVKQVRGVVSLDVELIQHHERCRGQRRDKEFAERL